MIHPKAEEGKASIIPSVVPSRYAAKVTVMPISRRHGSEISPVKKSFLFGSPIPQPLKLFTFSRRYQIRAIDGRLYMKILANSAVYEKRIIPCAAPEAPATPDKNRIVYRRRSSIYTPRLLFIKTFPGNYFCTIIIARYGFFVIEVKTLAIVVFLIFLALFIMIISHVSGSGKAGNWRQFFITGKEEGFSLKEIDALRRLVTKCELEDPCSIYSSQDQLETCIRYMVQSIRTYGESEENGTQNFLSKLYDFRKKIEMNKPRFKTSISNSRQIGESQQLRIEVAGVGVFKSDVVSANTSHLIISRPVSNEVTQSVHWPTTKVSVYFWREGDAGYVFDTKVYEDVVINNISCLKLGHSDSIFRTRKRNSIRVELHKPAFIYLAAFGDTSESFETTPGVKCFLKDLSDTGCAVLIAGQASPSLRVKVQFSLGNNRICIVGTVRAVDFNEEKYTSILRIEAEPLPLDMRNHILGEVFGVQSDDDSGLPFRVSESSSSEEETQETSSETQKDNNEQNSKEQEINEDLLGSQ